MPTPSLRAFTPPLRFDVHPLARVTEDGELVFCGPEFPPLGDLVLVLWRPGETPAFAAVSVRARREGRRWLLDGARGPAWIVLWWAPQGPGQRGI